MKICVAGQGAFGQKHLDALKRITDVEVVSLIGGNQDATAEVAKQVAEKVEAVQDAMAEMKHASANNGMTETSPVHEA